MLICGFDRLLALDLSDLCHDTDVVQHAVKISKKTTKTNRRKSLRRKNQKKRMEQVLHNQSSLEHSGGS